MRKTERRMRRKRNQKKKWNESIFSSLFVCHLWQRQRVTQIRRRRRRKRRRDLKSVWRDCGSKHQQPLKQSSEIWFFFFFSLLLFFQKYLSEFFDFFCWCYRPITDGAVITFAECEKRKKNRNAKKEFHQVNFGKNRNSTLIRYLLTLQTFLTPSVKSEMRKNQQKFDALTMMVGRKREVEHSQRRVSFGLLFGEQIGIELDIDWTRKVKTMIMSGRTMNGVAVIYCLLFSHFRIFFSHFVCQLWITFTQIKIINALAESALTMSTDNWRCDDAKFKNLFCVLNIV